MHRSYYVEGTELHLCDLDPKVKVMGQKAGIFDGVPSTSALVLFENRKKIVFAILKHLPYCNFQKCGKHSLICWEEALFVIR